MIQYQSGNVLFNTFTDFLIPAVHGRGIMPLALRTLIYEFLVPCMNVQQLTGAYFDHNSASKRVSIMHEKTNKLLQQVTLHAERH